MYIIHIFNFGWSLIFIFFRSIIIRESTTNIFKYLITILYSLISLLIAIFSIFKTFFKIFKLFNNILLFFDIILF
jgi:hypothetical protein